MIFLILLTTVTLSTTSKDPNFAVGRSTIVHLFEWKWTEIANECELFLGPYGYGGVQTSPPNENGIVWEPSWNKNVRRPWFERYQPVSYKLETRSGTENEFRDMVDRCNKAGVRIYTDMVINHMTGDIGAGRGTGGSYFEPANLKYDGVSYGPSDFNSKTKCGTNSGDIENYQNSIQVRNCKLSGLNDLDLGKEYVRSKIVEYMNKLIAIGVAGFRVDAAKHMWPGDLEAILDRLNHLNTTYFKPNARPLVFMEVIDLGGEPITNSEYTHLGRVTEFKFGKNLGDVIRKNNNQKLKYLRNFGEGWGMLPSGNAVVFVDNHDNQRGHGAGGFGSILTHFEARMYKMATAFTMAWPYALTRMMSSYAWNRTVVNGKDLNDWVGPPHDGNYKIKSVVRNPDLTCGNGWICEHRWRQMYNMAKFRNVVGFSPLSNWWDNGDNQIAFGRGDRGFIAINNDWRKMDDRLQTGLSKGSYCDIISGNKEGRNCTGRIIQVDECGYTHVLIESNAEDPMIAIHVNAKL